MFTDLSGILALVLGFKIIRPKINYHKANGGISISEMLNGEDRSLKLSIYLIVVSILSGIYYSGLNNTITTFNFTILSLLMLSSVFLILTVVFSMDFSTRIHNFFAKGFVIIQLISFILYTLNFIYDGKYIQTIILATPVIIYLYRLKKNASHENYALLAMQEHTYTMYLFVMITFISF